MSIEAKPHSLKLLLLLLAGHRLPRRLPRSRDVDRLLFPVPLLLWLSPHLGGCVVAPSRQCILLLVVPTLSGLARLDRTLGGPGGEQREQRQATTTELLNQELGIQFQTEQFRR